MPKCGGVNNGLSMREEIRGWKRGLGPMKLYRETKDGRSLVAKRYAAVIFYFFATIFAFARLFIIVEALRSLAYLPPGAFLATWTSNLPHVG